MPKPFDASLKSLVELAPLDWLRLLGHNANKAEVVESDISTVSGATDKVIHVTDPTEWIQHFEFQSGPDASKPDAMNVYSSLFEKRYKLPVRTTAILLAKKANLKGYTGLYTQTLPGEKKPYRVFRYEVVRVWKLLRSVATMPLAPISDVPKSQLPSIIDQMEQKMKTLPDPSISKDLWTTALILAGLKYEGAFVTQLFKGVQGMENSTVYQEIAKKEQEKGRLEEARRFLIQVGRNLFGSEPDAIFMQSIDSIATKGELEALGDRAFRVNSWEELLGLPAPKPTRRKKS